VFSSNATAPGGAEEVSDCNRTSVWIHALPRKAIEIAGNR